MQTIEFSEVPPSVNSLYPGKHRRFISKRYRDWITRASAELKNQKITPLGPGRYGMVVEVGKVRKGSDLSNRFKALEDFFVKQKVTPDDHNNTFIVMLFKLGNGVTVHLLDDFECAELKGKLWAGNGA